MAERGELAGEMMRPDASLHANQTGRHVGEPRFDLTARPFLAQDDRAAAIVANHVERVLADVDADHGDLGACCLGHGRAPGDAAPCQRRSLTGREHGRTIPFSDVPSQAPSARSSAPTPTHREVVAQMNRAEERAAPEDVGEQALMRGLVTAFPFFRLGLSCSSIGRRSADRPHNGFQEFPCRGPALTPAQLMVAVLPLASSSNGGAVGRSSASYDSSGPQPRATLRPSVA